MFARNSLDEIDAFTFNVMHAQLSTSTFVRPAEKKVKGSTTVFKALLDAMLGQSKMAICRYDDGASMSLDRRKRVRTKTLKMLALIAM